MAHVFLIKAPWTNKDFSFLKELGGKLSVPLTIFTPCDHYKEQMKKIGLESHNPYKFRRLAEEGVRMKPNLFVVVDWPKFSMEELEEFRFFLLSEDCPCLLLQSEDLFFEDSFLKEWVMGEAVRSLWEGECPLPPFGSRTLHQNIKFIERKSPLRRMGILSWLLLRQPNGNLLGWEGENQNRRDRNQKGPFPRKTCDRHFDVEKWSQCFRSFLRRFRGREKAQGIDIGAWVHDAGRSFSLKDENRAA